MLNIEEAEWEDNGQLTPPSLQLLLSNPWISADREQSVWESRCCASFRCNPAEMVQREGGLVLLDDL